MGRIKSFPDEPLPDVDFLRLDFDTCVLENHDECTFSQGTLPDYDAGHKSQMAQFCGHAPVCTYSISDSIELIINSIKK